MFFLCKGHLAAVVNTKIRSAFRRGCLFPQNLSCILGLEYKLLVFGFWTMETGPLMEKNAGPYTFMPDARSCKTWHRHKCVWTCITIYLARSCTGHTLCMQGHTCIHPEVLILHLRLTFYSKMNIFLATVN